MLKSTFKRDLDALPQETALVIRFTELVLAHDPGADALREEIVAMWGERALVSLAMAISATRIYPTLKYVLGYGKACARITVDQHSVSPIPAMPFLL